MKDFAPLKWGKRKLDYALQSGDYPFGLLQRQVNRLFDDFFSGLEVGEPLSQITNRFGGFNPRISVREDERELIVEAELPGMEEKDLDISLTKDQLTLRGEKRQQYDEKREGSEYISERAYGTFLRVIPLRGDIDEERVDAQFSKGVLTVRLPKVSPSEPSARKIVVRSETSSS